MWVAMQCSCHNLFIFLGVFSSSMMSHPCVSGEGTDLVAKSHCLLPAVEHGNASAYQGTCDP